MGLNRIYKVVWNKTKGCYVVVSELAKRVGRNKAKAIVMTTAAMAMAVSPMMADAAPAGNAVGQGHANAVALGPDSNASQDGAVALGKQSKATGTEGAALGKGAKAEGNLSVAVGSMSQATADSTMALGVESKASKNKAVALGRKAEATADNAMALGEAAIANQARAIAIGKAAISSGQDTIAIGTETNAKGHTSIVIGKNAKTTNDAEGTVVIGRDAFSEGSGKPDRPNTVVGRGAYTAFGENGTYRMNAATALGFQAGSGIRVDSKANNKLVDNNTNADSNENVLVKAGYGLQDIKDAAQKVEMDKTKAFLQAGFAHNGLDKTGDSGKSTDIANGLSFYRKSAINEATAIGAEARAIGDQSIAIGGQVVAGDGVVALGGNDTDQLRGNKYQVVTNDAVNRTNVNTIDDYNLAYTESTRTVAGQYKNLVGRDMPTGYRSTYGQSGSVVIGMEAHSTTALGTAIGTNSVVRMGAFGATAIGAGSTVQPNAEAAVAIGMGSVANGAYALAGGTASWAEYGDIALGYQAKASGKDGAIAMGRATNAQGDSSIMIGGANIASAAAQSTSFEKSNNTVTKKTVTEKINGKNVNREYTFAGTTKTNDTVAAAYKELTGRDMETNALNFADNKYKNGHASTSLGVHALSRGDLGTAIGAGSRADSIGSVALGVGARANRQNAVAIGTGSTTDLVGTRQLSVSYDKDGNVVDDNSPNKAYTFNWAGGTNTSEGDVVSFGSSGAERQLKNVAAGRVADDSTDAINGSQLNSVSKKLATGWNIAGDSKTKVAGIGTEDQVNFVNGNGTTVTVTKQEEVKNGNTVTTPKGANVKFDIKAEDGSIASTANGISVNTDGDTIGKTADGKLKANTGTINTGDDGKAAPNTGDGSKLATVDTVVNAVNNAAWKATAGNDGSGTETGKSEEKIKAGDVVTFKAGDNLAIKQAGKNFIYSLKPELTGLTSAGFKNAAGDTTVIDGNGMTITPKDAPAKPVSLTKDGLDNGGKTIKNVTSGLTNYGPGTPKEGLVDLSKPATGNPTVPDTTAATVGDLRNMGWVVSSDKTTGELTKAYTDQVKNADEVKFVGEGGVTVSGKTENGVRTITVKAEAQEMPEQPVSYTTADGTKVYPKTVTKPDGTKEVKYYSEPNGKGTEILKENVIASINGPEGTKAPTTLSNVAGNLDGAKKDTKAPTTEHAPVNTTDAAAPNYVNPNNAATVGDVLNAGWNLQNNGTAKDFVKPYDTVNFVNGANTTAVVTTSADGTTSNVTYNVTGLPVTYTDAEGNPVAKVGDKYYKVNNQGQPVDADGNPSTKVNDKGQPLDAQGNVIDPVDTTKPLKTALVNPTPAGDKPNTTSPTQLGNVANGANTFEPVDGKKMANDGKWYNAADVLPNGQPKENVQPVAKPDNVGKAGLIDFSNSNPNNAATVGDLQNLGWIVSAEGNSYFDQVRNANEVKFVGKGTATVTGETDANGVRTITVKVDDQVSTNNAVTPVVYTDKEGNTVYPIKDDKGNVTYHTTPDGKGENDKVVPNGDVNTSVNGPKDEKGNARPASLGNVKNNIPAVNDSDKKVTNPDGTEKGTAGDVNNINKAPLTATEAADLLKPTKDGKPNPNFAGNNAATVSDVLNAGWNLQNNGEARDFVKPYDTVNFVNGANTTAVVTTSADGTTSDVTYNVTGLPVTFTDKDGKPVSKIGDKYYPVNEKGQPITPDGKPAVKTNAEGKPVAEDGTVIEPIDTKANPLQSNLVNPNVANTTEKTNNQTTSPTQLGNVANGANTFEPVDGKKMANDGKWYPADQVEPNGQPKENVQPVAKPDNVGKAGLIDFSKSNPNNAATVGDLQNLGWIVSAEGNKYSDQVRNANEVKFVGEGTASVTGKTDENGVRTITVKVDDQVSTNNAQTPVNYTNKDGKKVYPVKDENGNVTYHTTPDGKGKGDETVPAGDVITSLNGPEGTTTPTTLNNVKNNIPAVNDADKKVTNPDGTEKGTAGDVNNINKAPLTATEAADLLKPTKDGKPNPNFAGNNAATVSDVLNAGWNLQNNGTAKDFVKPFDTVNFVDGANTTAVVTTNTDGTTSNVTYNVTGLPVTFTDKAGKPVSKIGDKYYPVNEKGQPVSEKGNPAVGTNNDGDLVDKDGNVIKPIDTAKDPLKSNMVNPNVANSEAAPNNQTTTPTQLGNVANGAETFKPADDVKLANDGKWYNAADVKPNGAPKTAEENNGKAPAPVANPLSTKNKAGDILEKGNDGNWYKASDLENGEPKPNAKEQVPVAKPENADKAGLINFENSNPNNAATVGDLQNMGFVVSAKDNGYTEQMRNANKVEFKGDNGVQVTGKTLADGTREITVALKEGRVTNDVLITDKDGKVTHGVRGEDGKIYTKDPKTGKATNEEIPVTPSDTVENDGNAYVTGNSVATAIQKSGWNIGIGSTDKAFSEEAKTYERVNPKDNVKYVNGANTTVSMAVDAAEDKDGATVTTTYVKVDVNRELHIDSVTTGGPVKDKAGNPLKPVNGEYYPENALVNDGKVYPAGTVMIDGKPYPAGSAKDPKTKTVLKDGKPAPEAQPLTATPKDQLADGKDGAMTVKDAKGNDGVSATAKDGKGTLTLKDVGKDGKDASQVDISTAKAPADLENTPKDAVRANDGNWYAPADVTVEVKDGKTVVTPKAGKTPIPNAPTMDRIQYTDGKGTSYNVATMNDGLRFVGDDGETISKPLNSTMEFTGGNREDTGKPVAKAATTTGNIGVFHDKGKLSIQLAKDLEKLNSANFESKTDKAGNPLKVVDGKYYPEKAVVKEGKVYPEGTVIIDNKPYPAGTTKDAAGNVVHNGKPATEATPINPIDSKQVQDGPTSRLTGTGLTFNTPTPKDENGNPLVLVDGKYYKADNLENGKPKADAKAEPVKPAQSTAFTPDGLVVTPETAKVRDANGNPVLDKDGREVVDPTKVVSFGSPTIAVDPKTGKPMVDPKTGEPVMKSGISAGGQVMANVAPGVLDTDAVNVSQLKGVSNMVMNVNNRVNRLGAQAAAMAGLRHLQYDPLEPTTIMAGVGAYKGEAALALGIAHYKNESTLFHAGASIGSRGDELMANAGVSWKFGARADETAVKDTFRQGPISSSYTLQDKVSALEAQNQVQKDEINNLKAQLAEVLQYVKKG